MAGVTHTHASILRAIKPVREREKYYPLLARKANLGCEIACGNSTLITSDSIVAVEPATGTLVTVHSSGSALDVLQQRTTDPHTTLTFMQNTQFAMQFAIDLAPPDLLGKPGAPLCRERFHIRTRSSSLLILYAP